jgi:hypothetical protein
MYRIRFAEERLRSLVRRGDVIERAIRRTRRVTDSYIIGRLVAAMHHSGDKQTERNGEQVCDVRGPRKAAVAVTIVRTANSVERKTYSLANR